MKLGEAISKVEELMTIGTLFDVIESGSLIHAAFNATRPYEESGEQKIEHGGGSFFIRNDGGEFEPIDAHFEAVGETHTTMSWKWDGEKFNLVEQKEGTYKRNT